MERLQTKGDDGLLTRLQLKDNALAGQTALITGAARGIGEATAYYLACLGTNVIIADILSRGQQVAEMIQAQGGQAHFIQCDVSSVEEVSALLTQAESVAGQVDILINSVMRIPFAPVTEISVEDWDGTINTNLRSAFLTMRRLMPGMLRRHYGVIINMISYDGTPLTAAYAAGKMGLRSLAITAAREVGPNAGVSIFAFLPGLVDTPGTRHNISSMAARTGQSEEQVRASLHIPGYAGLMPVEHCGAALAYTVAHAPEYHGQVADPFEPLNRYGIIQLSNATTQPAPEPVIVDIVHSVPQHINQYLDELMQRNRDLEQRIEVRTRELAEAHAQSESLLLNILPPTIAKRLKQGESIIADYFQPVTVLFADIVNFVPLTARVSPERVVQILDAVFSAFDAIAQKLQLEKIKTIGDCYMVVGGLPEPRPDHAEAVAEAAFDFLPALDAVSKELGVPLTVRMGMHTGSVVAGVIGKRKFSYDLWGDAVNTASRMESHGLANHIHCTREVYEVLRDQYIFESRGEMEVKGKGRMQTYFLVGVKS